VLLVEEARQRRLETTPLLVEEARQRRLETGDGAWGRAWGSPGFVTVAERPPQPAVGCAAGALWSRRRASAVSRPG